jgi:hypothetical protein
LIPESPRRARLLEVMALQSRLLQALCGLDENAEVNLAWLQDLWPELDADWVRKFWENDTGKRATWINEVARCSLADKTRLMELHDEQLRFAGLYNNPPTVRLTRQAWDGQPFASTKALLNAFYAPLFYRNEGFPNPDGTRFHKDDFIGHPPPKVCPYTDNYIQDTKLDHFLPKDDFPMLSMHPDNLIPCGTDPNSITHKGRKLPLHPNEIDQAADWFHPLHRSANGTFRLDFPAQPAPHPRVQFLALAPQNQVRLDNLENLFDLSEFWGRTLDDELQLIAGEIRDDLNENGIEPTEAQIQLRLQRASHQMERRIGRDALAIVKSAFYAHIALTPALLAQVERVCIQGT